MSGLEVDCMELLMIGFLQFLIFGEVGGKHLTVKIWVIEC